VAAAPDSARDARLAALGQDLVRVAYLQGHFVLRSGAVSSYYFDKYRFETQPALLRRVAACLAERIPPGTQRLAGPELGAVALAAAVSLELDLPFVIVRKAQKEYGTTAKFEGELQAGERVTMIEDVVTSGGAALDSVRALREAGAVVEDVIAVVDREEGGAAALGAEGLRFDPLFRRTQLDL